MRIACLISGEFREFAIAYKFWPFRHWDNIDFYFSLWSTSEIVFALDTPDSENKTYYSKIEPIDYNLISQFLPKSVIIESPYIPIRNHNALKMIRRAKSGLMSIKETGIHYDAVIQMRPDFISYVKNEYYLEQINRAIQENICLIDGIGPEKSGDSFIIYTMPIVDKYISFDFESPANLYCNKAKPNFIDIHSIYHNFFKDKADSLHHLTDRWTIVRSNARFLTEQEKLSFRAIADASVDWWRKRNLIEPAKRRYDIDCP